MAKVEREYNVPLRREWLKAPKYKRAKKAVNALRQFLQRHMKSEDVRLGKEVNKKVWSSGMRNPPHHVKVTAVKDEDGVVRAELTGVKVEAKAEKKAEAKEQPKAEPAKETPKAKPAKEKAEAKEAKVEKKSAEAKAE